MPKKRVIETGADRLVRLISVKKKISVKNAAKELGVPPSSVEEWAEFLEESGVIAIETRFTTVYLVEQKLTKKEVESKIRDYEEDKDLFIRKVEHSAGTVDRELNEISAASRELKSIKELVSSNIKKLSEQLLKLENMGSSQRYFEKRRASVESEYNKQLAVLETKLEKDKKAYDSLLNNVNLETKDIEAEKEKLKTVESIEKQLSKKLADLKKEVVDVQSLIESQGIKIEKHEEFIGSSKSEAEELKVRIANGKKELLEIKAKIKKSKEELEKTEKEFFKNFERLSQGKLADIDAYKKSKKLIENFKNFFKNSKELNELLSKADKDERALRKQFDVLLNKTKKIRPIMKVADKQMLKEVEVELQELEDKKKKFRDKIRRIKDSVKCIFS